jgi:hypothetical protein
VKDDAEFLAFVRAALAGTPIRDLLTSNAALVLERIARGGGRTEWYYCSGPAGLEVVERQLSPGSAVSFYFDGRISSSSISPQLAADIFTLIHRVGEIVVGVLAEDGVKINVDFPSSTEEVTELMSTTSPASRVFYGEFPAQDNDGTRAVSLILPDRDGIVRRHPH